MLRQIPFLKLLMMILIFSVTIQIYANDGIPDNCETAPADRINIFARYEPQNRRLMLVDWSTGADVQIVATDLPTTINPMWSTDCRYLSVAVESGAGWDTIVYDVISGARVGSIPDATGQPHPITWGPSPYLMVETRQGAILWNVSSNAQYKVTETFNKTTGRNFSRLRWDAANQQVSVNLAVGGREVYDLRTGERIPEAAHITDSIPDMPSKVGNIVIGGKPYECQGYTNYGYRNWFSTSGLPAVKVKFDGVNQLLFLELNNYSAITESLQMIEDNIGASWFRFAGWSPSCRYFAGHLGIPGKDASDTVVWDIVENRRVGVIPDARLILHRISWSRFDDALLVQTRHGAYLWHVPTNSQYLITTDVEVPLAGYSSIQNVTQFEWESGKLLIESLNAAGTWTVFDIQSGEKIAEGIAQQEYISPAWNTNIVQNFVPPNPIEGVTGYSEDPYYFYFRYETTCNGQTLRYDRQTRTLSIYESATDALSRIFADNLNSTMSGWSPDCNWIYGIVEIVTNEQQPYDNKPLDDIGRDRRTKQIIIWDVQSGQQRFVLDHPYRYGITPVVRWSPNIDRAIVYTSNGSYLINLFTGETVLLTFSQDRGELLEPRLTTIYWDYPRGQVLINGYGVVYTFDMVSGVEKYRFKGGADYWRSRFTVHDNKTLFVLGGSSAGVWDLDTLDHKLALSSGSTFGGSRVALSPDARYLVMGFTNLRVWDFSKAPADPRGYRPETVLEIKGGQGERLSGRGNRITGVEFIDNTTVKVTLRNGQVQIIDIAN